VTRDLASPELWRISLHRSLHRREIAALHRRHAPRRKGASLAVSAAVATAPIVPSLASAAGAAGGGRGSVSTGLDRLRARDAVALLELGATGDPVRELQRALHVYADGIFGPHTRAAVRSFQRRHGMRATGVVDLTAWIASAQSPVSTASERLAKVRTEVPSLPTDTPTTGSSGTPTTGSSGDTASGQDPAGTGSGDAGGAAPTAPPRPSSSPDAGGSAPSGPVGATGEGLVAAMAAKANEITRRHYAYSWGGGHNSSFSGPYDCSGAVSAVLHSAGLLGEPLVSGDFMRWGRPGRGVVTIYASPSHVYMSIRGRFFGTSYSNPGGGAAWFHGSARPGFAVVHVALDSAGRGARARLALGGLRSHGRRVHTSALTGGDEAPGGARAAGRHRHGGGGGGGRQSGAAGGGSTRNPDSSIGSPNRSSESPSPASGGGSGPGAGAQGSGSGSGSQDSGSGSSHDSGSSTAGGSSHQGSGDGPQGQGASASGSSAAASGGAVGAASTVTSAVHSASGD
jgi:peptidoglycan hydrolase-like protein with peptidoglycan-binding domain